MMAKHPVSSPLAQAAKAILAADTDTISFLLGGITVATAVVGTLGGGAHDLPVAPAGAGIDPPVTRLAGQERSKAGGAGALCAEWVACRVAMAQAGCWTGWAAASGTPWPSPPWARWWVWCSASSRSWSRPPCPSSRPCSPLRCWASSSPPPRSVRTISPAVVILFYAMQRSAVCVTPTPCEGVPTACFSSGVVAWHAGNACACNMRADAVSMWSVPIPQRPAGQALQVIAMHLMGDVPSPPITGAIQGAVPRHCWVDACKRFPLKVLGACGAEQQLCPIAGRLNNWRVTMAIVTSLLGISVACYLFGTLYAPRANDFREELKVPLRDEEVRVVAHHSLARACIDQECCPRVVCCGASACRVSACTLVQTSSVHFLHAGCPGGQRPGWA